MKAITLILAATMMIGAASSPTLAKSKWRGACKADLEKFCKDIKKGEGRKACLQGHQAELEAGCSDALKASKEAKAKKS